MTIGPVLLVMLWSIPQLVIVCRMHMGEDLSHQRSLKTSTGLWSLVAGDLLR